MVGARRGTLYRWAWTRLGVLGAEDSLLPSPLLEYMLVALETTDSLENGLDLPALTEGMDRRELPKISPSEELASLRCVLEPVDEGEGARWWVSIE